MLSGLLQGQYLCTVRKQKHKHIMKALLIILAVMAAALTYRFVEMIKVRREASKIDDEKLAKYMSLDD